MLVIPRPDTFDSNEAPETDLLNFIPIIEDIKICLQFIDALKNASLDSKIKPLDEDVLHQIQNPPERQLTIDSPDLCLSIDLYLGTGNALEESYNQIRRGVSCRFPETEILSYYKVK
jgi:hypothetical protein